MSIKHIEFYSDYFSFIEKPFPAKKNIPDYYKNLPMHQKQDYPKYGTAKRCIPFLDALTCGYYICSSFDMMFKKLPNGKVAIHLHDSLDKETIDKANFGVNYHQINQIGKPREFFYENEINIVFKLNNPWSIKTPKGYSCLFTNPTNRKLKHRVLEGIVDTDDYKGKINFPFILKEFDNYLIIRKGEPLILVFPFKRDNWKMKTYDKDFVDSATSFKFLSFIMNAYKNLIWKKKEYD